MTRTVTLMFAALALALAGCQEGSGLEEAPADQSEVGADIEKASGLSGLNESLASASEGNGTADQLAVEGAMCEDLAVQHKTLSEQIAKLRLQQANAAKMMAALEAELPVREGFEDDATYQRAHATHRAKVDAAQYKVANLDKQLKAMLGQEQELRAKMKQAGCKEIPEPKPLGDPPSARGGAVSAKPLGMLPAVGSGDPTPSPAPGGTSESGLASSSSSDSAIRNLK